MLKARDYIDNLQTKGRISFSTREFAADLALSDIATIHALHRLRAKKLIASPVRGFHVILGPSDRKLGCRPPDEFIDYLMRHLDAPYYVALLSAAEIHGAAHHRPQEYQVMVKKNRRPVVCGGVKIRFIAKSNLSKYPTTKYKVKTGYLSVSSPEVTAFDLVGYPQHAAGLDNVATVLNELSEFISAEKLCTEAYLFKRPYTQRLGYILQLVGAQKLSAALAKVYAPKSLRPTLLLPGGSSKQYSLDRNWQIIVNSEIQPG